MIETRLNTTTLRAWEPNANTAKIMLVSTDFLKRRCQLLERIEARIKKKGVALKIESNKQNEKAHEKQ